MQGKTRRVQQGDFKHPQGEVADFAEQGRSGSTVSEAAIESVTSRKLYKLECWPSLHNGCKHLSVYVVRNYEAISHRFTSTFFTSYKRSPTT